MDQAERGVVWRRAVPVATTALLRRRDDFHAVEDAVADALEAAVRQWPDGLPDDPAAWLVTVAHRRMVDRLRSQAARRRREQTEARDPAPAPVADVDDSLGVLVLCCHDALSTGSQVALALRAVFGLPTAAIARLFGADPSAMAQRISRAKATIRDAGRRFTIGSTDDLAGRLPAVCHALYLVFTEGHLAGEGAELVHRELTDEAIRLTEQLHARLPAEGEVTGLLALMVLLRARQPARVAAGGSLVPLTEQDRSLWDAADTDRGRVLISGTLSRGRVGSYQLQAAIAAVHADAPSAAQTDWHQIVELYDMSLRVDPTPVVALNRVVALAMRDGPAAGLAALATITAPAGHRTAAVRGHLLHELGRCAEAADQFAAAADLTHNAVERRHLAALEQRCRVRSGENPAAESSPKPVEDGRSAPTSG